MVQLADTTLIPGAFKNAENAENNENACPLRISRNGNFSSSQLAVIRFAYARKLCRAPALFFFASAANFGPPSEPSADFRLVPKSGQNPEIYSGFLYLRKLN
jgi:hypothetical protein